MIDRHTHFRPAAMISHQLLFVALAVPARALVGLNSGNRPGEALSILQTATKVEANKPSLSILQTEAESEAESMVSMSTLSTEEWNKYHDTNYEREFTIELDMAAAHEGMTMGAELWSKSDHDPLAVLKMADVGLVESWNRANPDKAVQVGDEIVQVGDVKWKHHNRQFIQHMKDQFGVLKEQLPGMKKVLELRVQRPRSSKVAPTFLQGGPDAKVAVKVFEIELDPKLTNALVEQNFDTTEGSNMTVNSIPKNSPLYFYNAAKPKDPVKVGDTVIAINGSPWTGNARLFLTMHKMVVESQTKNLQKGKPLGDLPASTLKFKMERRPAQKK